MTNQFTLDSFLRYPFGKQDIAETLMKYDERYQKFILKHRLSVRAVCVIEDSYYFHVTVPSESAKDMGYQYDVVIRFYTDDPAIKKENSISNYYVQFFSNSPSFIYKYAVLYKQAGVLIEQLYEKLDPEYRNKLPEKTNPNMEIGVDKSVYFAAKFLSKGKFRYLNKAGIFIQKKKPPSAFFAGIKEVQLVNLERSLIAEEQRLQKADARYKGKRTKENLKATDVSRREHIKGAIKDITSGNTRILPIKPGKHKSGAMSKHSSKRNGPGKKRPTKTTYRKI